MSVQPILTPEHEAGLQRWAARELGRSGVQVDSALSGGNANLTLLLKSDEGPMVLRTPPREAISATAHRGIERECQVLSALQGRVRVPEVLGWCEDASVLGRPFLLVSHVDGLALTDTLPIAYSNPLASVNRLGEELVDELAAIAAVPWQELGLEQFGRPEGFLKRQIERWQTVRAAKSVRELPLLDDLAEWLLSSLPAEGSTGIVHGDYHLDNTLVDAQRAELLAVIDWELATIGDPLVDLGLLLMFWGPRTQEPPGFAHVQALSRVDGVLARRELAQRWSRATGRSCANLDFYLCFAFWRLAAIVEGAYCLYREGKVDTPYARGLEYDVPALLREAEQAAGGQW